MPLYCTAINKTLTSLVGSKNNVPEEITKEMLLVAFKSVLAT
jgi:hypothetical protein